MKTDSPSDQNPNWVIVADEARALFYAQETRRSPLREILSLKNEKAQRKNLELNSDRDGRSFDSHGRGRHSMTNEKMGPKKHAATVFSKVIVARIAKAMHDGHCREYAVVAAPRFLGLLRDALAATSIAEPYVSIDKEVVGQDTAVIQKLLEGAMTR